MADEVENFFGCYLLVSTNPRFKGRTYIGFTVDPNRRLKQHNTGRHAGGAFRTSGRGPWDMILLVHGFPNMITALRFEWAWQHPEHSRRLKDMYTKHKKLKGYVQKFYIMCDMLRIGPWNRLPLTVQWLNQDYAIDFDLASSPPKHMAVAYGPVKSVRHQSTRAAGYPACPLRERCSAASAVVPSDAPDVRMCCLCSKPAEDADVLTCFQPDCRMISHSLCLASHFLREEDQILPVDGPCPLCRNVVLWADLLLYKKGCYRQLLTQEVNEVDEHWTHVLTQTAEAAS